MIIYIIRNNLTNQMIVLKHKRLCRVFCEELLKECSLEHYTSWLDVHDKKDNNKSWKEYRLKVKPTADDFIVMVAKIKRSAVKGIIFNDKIVKEILKGNKED